MNAENAYQTHEVQKHAIQSHVIAQTFNIRVLQPISRTDNSERFPVLYLVDSDDYFGTLVTLANFLQFYGEAPRFILVGIGYADARGAALLRLRDFLSHDIRSLFHGLIEQLAGSPLGSGVEDLKAITHTTDARDFQRFIREELMPFIARLYPVIPNDSSYAGYSGGGTFGLYTLFTKPDTFRRYILGSPATSYASHHFGLELANTFIKSGERMDAKVFMSVGELEEFGTGRAQYDLVTGYYLLAKCLKESNIPGLDLTLQVFANETHATAWAPAFSHGLKAVFGGVDKVPFWPE